MDDLSGRVIRGYELRGHLGAGGFGAVYRAFQPNVGREVAIKVILPDYANQPEFIRRFETEAQLVARLEHPFIVPLFDFWRDPDGAYLVMRLFRGGSLRSRLQKDTFTTEAALKLVDQIAGALAVAHRNGVVHRDLKPDNILLDEDENAYLTDFGIAKINTATTSDDDSMEDEGISGSPGYMSPEQIMSSPVTPQTDIYSLGVMIYELLTGKHPFPDSDIGTLIIQHLNEPLPHLEELKPDLPLAVDEVIQRATAKEPSERFADVLTLASALRSALLDEPITIDPAHDDFDLFIVINPYKGLRPFEEADAADFFGRELLVTQLRDRLAESTDNNRFLAVVGPSGSGKSSVVKAGLIPTLRKGGLPGSENWFMAEMLPGVKPFQQLEAALLSVATQTSTSLESMLRENNRGLITAVEKALPPASQFLLVIDQFEEIFTLLDSEAERTHFLDLLRTAVSEPGGRIHIIVTLRADFYDRPLLYEGFGTLMRARTEVVLPLSVDELERAITGPAERVGLVIDSNLLAAVVADVREEPGALPLLQYVLTEVFERREGRVLTLHAYQESGGALGALARRADELYQAMDEKSQAVTRQLFLRLVTLGEGREDTRRRVHWAELMAVDSDQTTMQSVLDSFGKYRLLSFDRDPQTREPTVEVAHEALIREWTQLRAWLTDSREDIRLQRNLSQAADEWAASQRDSSFLLGGTRLAQLEEWAGHTDLALTAQEQAYLHASITQRTQQEAEETERRARELELERQARSRLRILLAVMSAAAVIALVLSVFAFRQQQIAQQERDNAEQARGTSDANAVTATVAQGRAEIEANNAQVQANLAATAAADARREAEISRSLVQASNANLLNNSGNRPLALALALIANSIPNPPAQVQRVLGDIVYLPGAQHYAHSGNLPVNSAAFSTDGSIAATASDDSLISLWQVTTGELIRTMQAHSLQVTSIAFSPNGSQLVSGSWDRTVIIWDITTGTPLHTLTGHSGVIYSVAFSPDGKIIASGSVDGIFIWDALTGENLRQFGENEGNILTLAFSPDNTTLASGTNDDTIVLWNYTTGGITQRWRYTSDILSIAFNPDGERLLSTSRDTVLVLWDIATGAVIRRISSADGGHTLQINSVTFTPDGNRALSASDDESIILWDVQSGQLLQRFEARAGAVNIVKITSDGRTAISGSDTGLVAFWNIQGGASIQIFQQDNQAITDVAYHPLQPGQIIAASTNTRLYLWNQADGSLLQTFEGHTGAVNSVSIGQTALPNTNITPLLSGSSDMSLLLWDIETGEILRRFEGHTDSVSSVALSPDSRYALSGSDDSTIILWDTTTGEIVRRFGGDDNSRGHSRRVLTVTFSPDAQTALSGSVDRTMILWDVATGEPIHVFEGHSRRVLTIAYSPDGSKALSGSDDGSIILWDLTNQTEMYRFNTSSEGSGDIINTLSYSPDGLTAISGTDTGQLILWDIQTGQAFRFINTDASGASASSSVANIEFSANGQTAFAGMADGRVVTWYTPTLEQLINWAYTNREIPELTCQEREQYSVEPLCDLSRNTPTPQTSS